MREDSSVICANLARRTCITRLALLHGSTTVFAFESAAAHHRRCAILPASPVNCADVGARAWLLQTKALIMINFANILLDKAIISSETFTALLLMAIGSTMLTIPVVTPRLARYVSDDGLHAPLTDPRAAR